MSATIPATSQRKAVLNMPAEEFRSIGHSLIDALADFIQQLPHGKVTKGLAPSQVKAVINSTAALPSKGSDAAQIVKQATTLLAENSLFNGHPKFLGYITSSPAPIGALADLLAAVMNPNCGAFALSPMATEIELQSIQWLSELMGYEKNCGGILVSGGNMANIIGLWAARKAVANWNIREDGLTENGLRYTLYATKQVHTWLQKTADLIGIGLNAIRWIPMNEKQQMNVKALDIQLQKDKTEGFIPLAVIATAGSVGFGTVDPLQEISETCKKHQVWFHVDGAYGALAAALPEMQETFKGMSEADSLAVDPHKWLYCPLEVGCTLVRRPELLLDVFSFHPDYYLFDKTGDEAPVNFYEYGPQNSRGFRALKVWMVLQQAGKEGIVKMIRDDINLATELFNEIKKQKSLEALTKELSITTFRYVPEDLSQTGSDETYLNQLNTEILARLQKAGELFVSNSVLQEKYLLRSCIVNFRTSLKDIQEVPAIVIRCGEEVDKEMRKQ